MAVQFVIGRAGSGKTRRCFDAIVAAMRAQPIGPPIYWILPKQATFEAERRLTCASGLGGFCRARMLSFEMLGEEVLADCGGIAIPQITPLGRQMILGHLLRRCEKDLIYFRSAARQVGLATRLDATFAEIERAGKSAEDLKALLNELEDARGSVRRDDDSPPDDSLTAKVHDLHRIYDAYCAFLGQERLDPHRRLQQVLACVQHASVLQGADLYVDGFYEFTDCERRMLSAIAGVCRHVVITLPLDPDCPVLTNPHWQPDKMDLFHPVIEAYKHLWFRFTEDAVKVSEPVLLREVHRFADASLAKIERELFADLPGGEARDTGQTSDTPAATGTVCLIEAADRRAEVDAAARKIRELLREGMRLRDIAVLMRDIGLYEQIIEASFAEHDLPYFVDRRRTAAHHPLLQLVRGVFLIALHHWPHEPLMTVLKCGLAGLTLDEADELENYVLLHRIHGSAWESDEPWTFARAMTLRDEAEPPPHVVEAERMDALRRRVVDPMRPFLRAMRRPRLAIRQIVVELYALLDRLGVPKTLSAWMEQATARQEHELRGEHEQVWTQLGELFEQMVELLGDEQVDTAGFLNILDSALEQFDLALTPPTVDQVLVGQVDRARNLDVRAVVLLGMNEGVFPHPPREDSVLSDRERRTLRDNDLKVNPDTERRLLDEAFFGYVAFTRATERLILTRSLAEDDGRAIPPSPFWHRVLRVLPDVQIETVPREHRPPPQRIGTPRQLVTALMRWVRQLAPDEVARSIGRGSESSDAASIVNDEERRPVAANVDGDPWPALYHWLATHDCCGDAIDVMRYRAWKALSYRNEAQLSPEVAGALFPSPLNTTVPQIETFATCPFKHFVRYGLRLRPRQDADVTPLDLSRVYHSVLERIVRQMLKDNRDWVDLDDESAERMIKAYAQEVGQALRSELMLSSARNKYLLQHIEKTLAQVVAHQRAMRQRSQFRPAHSDVAFGDHGQMPPLVLTTPGGRELRLHGRIDRVDILADTAECAVIDYRLSGSRLSLGRVYHGLSLQLLSYLLVLQANGQALAGRPVTPVAGFYLNLLRKLEEVAHPKEAPRPDDPTFDLREKPRGVVKADAVDAFDTEMPESGPSKVICAHRTKKGGFGYRDRTDVADQEEFAALLEHVRMRLEQLADQILSGAITLSPYRINRQTPCPHCEYRGVCRFDPAINNYHHLNVLKREDILRRLAAKGEP